MESSRATLVKYITDITNSFKKCFLKRQQFEFDVRAHHNMATSQSLMPNNIEIEPQMPD